jgi:uncharacterized protein (TIGR00251 family)
MPDPRDTSDHRALRRTDRGVAVDVLVVPNARSAEVVGIHGSRVKVRVTAPPERLRANAAVIELLCTVVGVRRAEVIAGRTTRFKTVELIGADLDTVSRALSGP